MRSRWLQSEKLLASLRKPAMLYYHRKGAVFDFSCGQDSHSGKHGTLRSTIRSEAQVGVLYQSVLTIVLTAHVAVEDTVASNNEELRTTWGPFLDNTRPTQPVRTARHCCTL